MNFTRSELATKLVESTGEIVVVALSGIRQIEVFEGCFCCLAFTIFSVCLLPDLFKENILNLVDTSCTYVVLSMGHSPCIQNGLHKEILSLDGHAGI